MVLSSMLHTSLSLALLAGGADAPAARPLTDLMPSEAMAVIEVGDLGAALATPVEERGDWLRLLMDERFTAPLIELAEFGDDEELVRGIGAVLADVRGGAAAYDALDGGLVLAALDVDEDFGPALEAILQGAGLETHQHELAGLTGFMDTEDADAASFAAFTSGTRAYLATGATGGLADHVLGMLARAKTPEDREPWWSGADRGGVDALVGVHLDLSALPMGIEFEMLFQSVADAAYLGLEIGDGRDGGVVMSASLVGGETSDAFADCFAGEADMDLLLAAPAGVRSAQAVHFDPLGFLDAIVALVDAIEPSAGAGEMIEAALESASGFIGLDVEEDLLGNLTGHMFAFQWLDDVEGYVAMEDTEEPLPEESEAFADAFVDAFPVIGFGLEDEEPFIELLELLEPFVASTGGELTDEDDATTLRIAPEDVAFEILLRAGDGYLIAAADAGHLEQVVGRMGRELYDGTVDEALFSSVKESVGGAGVAVIDPTLFTEFFLAALASTDAPEGELGVFMDMVEAADEHIGGACLSEGWMNARSVGGKFLTR